MKKALFLVGLMAAPLFAAPVSDNLVKGLELVKNQKAEWFNYEKELHTAKYELLEKEHNKMFDQKISLIKESTNLDDFEQKMLTNLLTSHKATMKQWHDMGTSFQSKAKTIYERQAKNLEELETAINPTESEPEIEEVDVEEMELE